MKINPFEGSNPMSWTDAAKVSVILTLATFFITFLTPYAYGGIMIDLSSFIYEALRFVGATFFSNFIALAGLAEYMKKKNEEE